MKRQFKIQDSNGRRFIVYANDRIEARKIASRMTTAKTIYILN